MMSEVSASPVKISIALCTFNGAEFLSEQLESFRNQTRLPDEVIIGDDCSNDKTIKIIEDFEKDAPFPVHLKVNEKNLGSTKNFDQTISRCTGDLIFLSDQDDIWLPEKIAVIEKGFEKNSDVGVLFSNADLIDENNDLLGLNLWEFTFTKTERNLIKNGKDFEVFLRRNVITGATMAFRSELKPLFVPISKEINNLIHDGWIALISSLYTKVSFINSSLILYRQHGNQQIGVDWETRQIDKFSSKFSREFNERAENFNKSINFFGEEIKRIKKTVSVLKTYVESEQSIKISFETFDKLADKFTDEKLDEIAHLKKRKALPNNRLKRILPVLKESFTKRYHLYSRGFYGIGRDLFERWK